VWNETEEKWYFVVEDVIAVLTDSNDPKQYIKRMRQRDLELANGWVQIVPTLYVETSGGNSLSHILRKHKFQLGDNLSQVRKQN
ncbi:MAG: hypothetical protein ACOYMD_11715, partial [Paludibacter sp.]